MSVVFVEFSVCVFRLTWCYTIMRGSSSQTDEKSEVDAVSGAVKRQQTTYNSKQQAGYVTKQTENVPNMSKCSRCVRIPSWLERMSS